MGRVDHRQVVHLSRGCWPLVDIDRARGVVHWSACSDYPDTDRVSPTMSSGARDEDQQIKGTAAVK